MIMHKNLECVNDYHQNKIVAINPNVLRNLSSGKVTNLKKR